MTDQTPTEPEAQPQKKWGKGKIAKFAGGGCCILLVVFFAIGLIGAAITGDLGADPEPSPSVEQTTEPDATPEPEETTEPEEAEATTEPEPTEEPEPEPTEEPTEEPVTEEPNATEEQPSTDEGHAAQVEEIQGQLDLWFEGCDWQASEDGGIAQATCAEHEIGIIVGPGDSSVQGILDAIGETGSGGYFIEDGVAVWSTDMGNVRMAWDVLGTPGTPTEF